jgi:hypothetical protein
VASGFIPESIHQNNPLMFQIGRALKDVERSIQRSLTLAERRRAFEFWAKDAQPFWRPGVSKDNYWFEFLDACERAQWGLHEDPRQSAWATVQDLPLPQLALDMVEDGQIRRLIAFCMEMQRRCGFHPFFVSTRWLAERLQVSHTQVALWLRGLCHMDILQRKQKATKSRCPRYVCPSALPPTEHVGTLQGV